MSLVEEVKFWKRQADEAATKEAAFVAFGIHAGLQLALDHADEIAITRINQLGWPFSQ